MQSDGHLDNSSLAYGYSSKTHSMFKGLERVHEARESYETGRSSRQHFENNERNELLLDVITEKPNDESGNYIRRESSGDEMADIGELPEDASINKPMETRERRGTAITVQTEMTMKTNDRHLFSEIDEDEHDYMAEFVDRVEKRFDKDWYHLIEKEVQRDTHQLYQE